MRYGEGLWTPGVPFTLRVELSDGWISGTVSGEYGPDLHLGRIRTPGQTDPGTRTTAFVENWTMRCASAPRASALFYPPESGDGEISARLPRAPHPQCAPPAKHPYDGGVYIEIGGDGAFGADDRERIDALLGPTEHIPLWRRPWWRALIERKETEQQP